MKIIWYSPEVNIPSCRRRVVCGRGETAATFCPTSALIRVDLPTLGRPMTATNPDLYFPASIGIGEFYQDKMTLYTFHHAGKCLNVR